MLNSSSAKMNMDMHPTGLRQRNNNNNNNNNSNNNTSNGKAHTTINTNNQTTSENDSHDQRIRIEPQSSPTRTNHHDTHATTRTDQTSSNQTTRPPSPFSNDTFAGQVLTALSNKFNSKRSPATFAGFLSLLILTMANYMLGPMRDAAALKIGVSNIPLLTLVSTILALASSVPVGWLFEAPNTDRKGRSWRDRVGLTRGETQGTSLALFLRCFAACLFGYAFSFMLIDFFKQNSGNSGNGSDNDNGSNNDNGNGNGNGNDNHHHDKEILNEIYRIGIFDENETVMEYALKIASFVLEKSGKAFYVMFFLVVHLMKLHSISLMWGVTSEAMEYEEQAESRAKRVANANMNNGRDKGDEGENSPSASTSTVGGKSR